LTGIETNPNEIVREAMERALLTMPNTYSIVVSASNSPHGWAVRQVIENRERHDGL
jgi:hypothetical protein